MKSSKIKLLSSFFGLTATSAIIATTVVACGEQTTSENQDSSQNKTPPPDQNTNNPSNQPEENQSKAIEWSKIFPGKNVLESKSYTTVLQAIDEIKSIDNVWSFYSKPTNIPDGYEISFKQVQSSNIVKNSILVSLEAKQINTNQIKVFSFLIYGFATYSDSDYELMFNTHNANAQAKSSDPEQNVTLLDPRSLNDQEDSSYFFKNYYEAKIPEVFNQENISVKLISYQVNDDDTVSYNYQLEQQDSKTNQSRIIANPTVVVSGFYNYPKFSAEQIVNTDWKPANDDFIRNYVKDLSNKKDLNQFVVDHWNQSLANDALNAIRWVYTDLQGQEQLTSNMKEYIAYGYSNPNSGIKHWTMGYLMGYEYSSWGSLNKNKIVINPTYNSNVTLEENNDLRLTLGWYQKQYKQSSIRKDYTADVDGNIYFEINPSVKPIIDSNDDANVAVHITAQINNEAPGERPTVSDSYDLNINILDALYYYYNQDSAVGKAIKDQMFSSSTDASNWNKNLYSTFRPIFYILDTDTAKFVYRK